MKANNALARQGLTTIYVALEIQLHAHINSLWPKFYEHTAMLLVDNANSLTFVALALFIHLVIILVFIKFVIGREPSNQKRAAYVFLLAIVPFLGALLVYKFLNLNWFRNEDGSKRAGAISIDFLELDAIFNPGSKHVLEERQRGKKKQNQNGKKFGKPKNHTV